MTTEEKILRMCLASERDKEVMPGVTALEMLRTVTRMFTACPFCGAEAFVNIDCDVCAVCGSIDALPDDPAEPPRDISRVAVRTCPISGLESHR